MNFWIREFMRSTTYTLPDPSKSIPMVLTSGPMGAESAEYASARSISVSTGWFATAPAECLPWWQAAHQSEP